MRTITLDTIKAINTSTFSVQDNSPRGVKTVTAEEIKPGDRVVIDNHFCEVVAAPEQEQAAEQEQEQAAEQEQDTTADILRKAADIIEARKDRSAWDKGVNAYALELLDNLAELTPDDLADPESVRGALLNGADNWQQYSEGGCALICDCDIAARLCTPSELRRCKGGDLNPNSRETWLDVQARALFQAACSVRLALCAAVKEMIA